MNARPSRRNLAVNLMLAVAALALVWVAWSPRDSLYDRLAIGGAVEFRSSLALVAIVAIGIVASYRFFAWRVFWFFVLVAVASGTFHNARLEQILLWVLVAGLAITYMGFLGKLSVYMIEHPSQSLLLVVFVCLLYGVIGTGYGVPNLFWYETFWGRFFSAFGSTLLLAVLGVNAFFLDDKYHRNWKLVEKFLRDWKVDFPLDAEDLKLGYFFGEPDITTDDPNKAVPEPRYGAMISCILRAGRLPMLTLISLPALFPLMFPHVPRFAPRSVPFVLAFLDPERTGSVPDVGRDLRAWLLGITCWGLGILAGVFLVKVLIRAGMRLETAYEKRDKSSWWSGVLERRIWDWLLSGFARVLYVLIAALALGMTIALDLGWWLPEEWSLLQWVHIVLVLLTMMLGAAWSAFRAMELRPGRWAPFLRFLLLCAATYGLIALADALVRRRPGSELVSPGMAVCMLLMTLSLLGSWVAKLRPVRDGGAGWISYLEELETEARVAGDLDRVARIGEQITLYRGIAPKRFRSDLLVVAILALWIALMNADDFKLRFGPLRYDLRPLANWKRAVEAYGAWGKDFRKPRPAEIQDVPELRDDRKTLDAWRDRLWSLTPDGRVAAKGAKTPESFLPKLVVVCATGGASRAAYWTARVLHRLGADIRWSDDGKRPGFHDSVRLVTGASGGVVGAAHYLVWRKQALDRPRRDEAWVGDDTWVKTMPTENLSAVASHIALVGVAQSLLPRLPSPLDYDRGQALDSQWPLLTRPFSGFRDDEGRGALPSLVFTPVTVDDGRRLLISNLALHRLIVNRGDEVDADGYGEGIYSIAAPEFYRVFGKNGNGLTLAIAARMAATFPLVSPAVNLPTDPPVRVVDAGYYDNYGVNIAAAWLFHNIDWLVKNTSGVALVQIRAFMGRRERLGTAEPSSESIADGLQFFSTPFQAFAGMRESMPMFRNDEEVAALGEVFARQSGRGDFFTTVIFENSAQVLFDTKANFGLWPMQEADRRADEAPVITDVAMTWYLTKIEKSSMDEAIPTDDTAKHLKLVANQLVKVDLNNPGDKERSLWHRPADRLRWLRSEHAALTRTPGAAGATRAAFSVKELERALNYERIQALKAWWDVSK